MRLSRFFIICLPRPDIINFPLSFCFANVWQTEISSNGIRAFEQYKRISGKSLSKFTDKPASCWKKADEKFRQKVAAITTGIRSAKKVLDELEKALKRVVHLSALSTGIQSDGRIRHQEWKNGSALRAYRHRMGFDPNDTTLLAVC